MTETAIDSGMFRDLYVSLGEPVAAAPGACAFTTNRLSAGSGVARC
jgi:cytochrome c biogenesis factor